MIIVISRTIYDSSFTEVDNNWLKERGVRLNWKRHGKIRKLSTVKISQNNFETGNWNKLRFSEMFNTSLSLACRDIIGELGSWGKTERSSSTLCKNDWGYFPSTRTPYGTYYP